jgi:putative addiction module component (TIGR02574 family)
MALVQLQAELSKLSPQEQLVLADFLVMHAEKNSEPSKNQHAELDRRYAEALAKPESLLAPEDVVRRLRR